MNLVPNDSRSRVKDRKRYRLNIDRIYKHRRKRLILACHKKRKD